MEYKNLNIIKGVHFGKDENGNMVINPTGFMWKMSDKLAKKVEKGDIVLAFIKTKDGVKKGVPVLVVDIIENYDNAEKRKIRSVLRIIEKVSKSTAYFKEDDINERI